MDYFQDLIDWVSTWPDTRIETTDSMREYFGIKMTLNYHHPDFRRLAALSAARAVLVRIGVIEKVGFYKDWLKKYGTETDDIDGRTVVYKKGPMDLVRRKK